MRSRRAALRALAVLPVAAAAAARPAHARDYASASEVLETIDVLSLEVEARADAVAGAVASARAFVASLKADLARHRRERARLREARGETRAKAATPIEPLVLTRLRSTLEQLMHAHAEGLPALAHGASVQRLAEHMVDLSRLLAVVDVWLDDEDEGD